MKGEAINLKLFVGLVLLSTLLIILSSGSRQLEVPLGHHVVAPYILVDDGPVHRIHVAKRILASRSESYGKHES